MNPPFVLPWFTPALSAGVAFLTTLVVTPVVLVASRRLRLFDLPGPLKIHARPTPRTGGIALVLGLLAGILIIPHARAEFAGSALVGLIVLWLAGILDDLRGLSVSTRLAVQIVSASFLWKAGYRFPIWGSTTLGMLLFVLACLVAINAFNFLDGSDALASGVFFTIAVAFSAAFLFFSPSPSPALGLAASLAAASAAFLVFNFPPAGIFLGDSGSTVLGFAFVWMAAEFVQPAAASGRHPSALLFPLFAALLPLLDFFFAVFRRFRRGSSPSSADRRHGYDLLLARGWTPRRVALTFAALTLVLCALALSALRWAPASSLALFVACVLILSLVGARLGAARWEDQPAASVVTGETFSKTVS